MVSDLITLFCSWFRNAEVSANRVASHRNCFFGVVARGRGDSILSVQFERFFYRRAQILQEFLTRLALGIDTRDLLHPADPPSIVFLNNGRVVVHEFYLAAFFSAPALSVFSQVISGSSLPK